MTVSENYVPITYVCDSGVTEYSFEFKIFEETDLTVYKLDADTDLVLETLELNTDYTVSISLTGEGGSITLLSAFSSDYKLTIARSLPLTQPEEIPAVSVFASKSIEAALDRLTILVQQNRAAIANVLQLSITETEDVYAPNSHSSGYWYNEGDGTISLVSPSTTMYNGLMQAGVLSARPSVPGKNDIYLATDTKELYLCFNAGTWTSIPVSVLEGLTLSGKANNFITVKSDESAIEAVGFPYSSAIPSINLNINPNAVAPNNKIDITATSSLIEGVAVSNVSVTADITVAGAGGLDAGSEANAFYYIYLICNATGSSVSALLSTNPTSPTMPTGYTKKRLIGAVYNNASLNFNQFRQKGSWLQFVSFISLSAGNPVNPLIPPVSTIGTFTAVVVAASAAKHVKFRPYGSSGDYVDCYSIETLSTSTDAFYVTCDTDSSQRIELVIDAGCTASTTGCIINKIVP